MESWHKPFKKDRVFFNGGDCAAFENAGATCKWAACIPNSIVNNHKHQFPELFPPNLLGF